MDTETVMILSIFGAVCIAVAVIVVRASSRMLPASTRFSVDAAVVKPERTARVGDVRIEVVSGTLRVAHRRSGTDRFLPAGKAIELRGSGWLIGSMGEPVQVWVHRLRKRSVWQLQPDAKDARNA